MVEPSWRSGMMRLWAVGCACLLAGCSMVPRTQVEEYRKLGQARDAENARLKDSVLSLKSQYEDLAQRADDDARRLKAKDEENRRLLASVQAYQEEREQYAALTERLKRVAQASANPLSASLLERVEGFAKARPGCEFDARSGILTLASDRLFQAGTDRLTTEGGAVLKSFADLLGDPGARAIRLLVAGHTDDSPVRRTGLRGDSSPPGHLSLDRANRVRDLLSAQGSFDASRIEVAGFESSRPKEEGPDDASRAKNRRIEIQLLSDSAPASAPSAVATGP